MNLNRSRESTHDGHVDVEDYQVGRFARTSRTACSPFCGVFNVEQAL
jgi:hypothetical protein